MRSSDRGQYVVLQLGVRRRNNNRELQYAVILDNDQLDTHLLYFTIRLLKFSTCFEHYMLIIRRLNCIDAANGIVPLSKWPFGAPDGHLLRVTIPDTSSIQSNLLMMSI